MAGSPMASVSSTTSSSPPLVAPRLSIVVLPFTNLGNDPEQQYFADGITEDLTTDLSRISGMFVISRNTAFTYRNRPIDTKQIGLELGVRYAVRLRITPKEACYERRTDATRPFPNSRRRSRSIATS
jgi:TolB-like protein